MTERSILAQADPHTCWVSSRVGAWIAMMGSWYLSISARSAVADWLAALPVISTSKPS